MRIKLENRNSKRVFGVFFAISVLTAGVFAGASTKALLALEGGTIVLAFLRVELKNKATGKYVYILLFILVPVVTFFLTQFVQNLEAFSLKTELILLNVGICLVFQQFLLIFSSNIRFSVVCGCCVPVLLSVANDYVFRFRGNELTPLDFLSVGTAANVATKYDFTPTPPMIYTFALIGLLSLGMFCLPKWEITRNWRICMTELGITAAVFVAVIGGCTQKSPRYWMNYGAIYNGYILNFTLQFKDIYVPEPEGYSNDTIDALESTYPEENKDSLSYPDIIVIMDESFANLGVFENELSTNMEVMPFISSLQENTVWGYLNASVFGGSTANSEYEFLSGNSMAFLPQGSIVYQQFISDDSYSLISVLKEQGYDCVAMHPYYANGWMREAVYSQMGFDEMYFLEDFPQEQLIREYVSDQEMFEYIIDYHEQHDENTPLFLFGVTMQNHGGYSYEGPNYETKIHLEGYSREYPDAEQYLTLIHETDKAVEYLIEYYESIDRDVVIAFFGDHMPKLDNAFYEELNCGSFHTLDEQMRKQMVPFFVWANFDIEEKDVPCSSINYLSTYVLEAAGISLPPYYQFLKQTESLIPAINAYGYYSQEKQGFISLEEASGAEAEAINTYEILQYNNIFDKEGRSELFFGP